MSASTNYTTAMIAELKAQSPLNHAKAKALAATDLFATRSVKSIIAKAKSEGIDYIAATRPTASNAPKLRKADLIAAIQASTDTDDLSGLKGATMAALSTLLASLA